jgi:hypothetical protein
MAQLAAKAYMLHLEKTFQKVRQASIRHRKSSLQVIADDTVCVIDPLC